LNIEHRQTDTTPTEEVHTHALAHERTPDTALGSCMWCGMCMLADGRSRVLLFLVHISSWYFLCLMSTR